ncbi:hypothetical protein Ccrd_015950 [Cynara cardunculus var. scolymus]|uniref:Uncharacterized protein n=1 Tax=Cynara cardunculus var. scolymus TaxID=59895 RepID=A0A124SG97_CYNCS|nr:hypothetical protein Ccrd_015950 [Cynara cardunculus var. scolymus]
MDMMMYYPLGRCSYEDSLKVIEADIQHANALAAAIPRAKDGARFQMKLVHDQLTPLIMFLLQWIDSSCTCLLPRYLNLFHVIVYKVYTDGRPKISRHGRKATVGDFYAVILPSLRRLHYDLVELDDVAKVGSLELKISGQRNLEKDDGNSRSASCPFCRGNIKRVKSRDLWVLTCNDEVIDADLVSKEDLVRFYLYINNLPKDSPDALFFMFYEYLI